MIHFNFRILKFEDYDIIDTKNPIDLFDGNIDLVDYIEMEKELYHLERKNRK